MADMPDIVRCLFCEGAVLFTGLPAQRYKSHLLTEHNILTYNTDKIVMMTLEEQMPEYYSSLQRPVQEREIPPPAQDCCRCQRAPTSSVATQCDLLQDTLDASVVVKVETDPRSQLDGFESPDFHGFESPDIHLSKYPSFRELENDLDNNDVDHSVEEINDDNNDVHSSEEERNDDNNDVHSSGEDLNGDQEEISSILDSDCYSDFDPGEEYKVDLEHSNCRSTNREHFKVDEEQTSSNPGIDHEDDLDNFSSSNEQDDMSDNNGNPSYLEDFQIRNASYHPKVFLKNITKKKASCTYCNKSFGNPKLLSSHIKIFHEKTDVKREETTLDATGWTNQCFFSCQICTRKISYLSRRHHLQNFHNRTLESYSAQYGSSVNKRYHQCMECREIVLWTTQYIKRHLQTRHSSSTSEYYSSNPNEYFFKHAPAIQEQLNSKSSLKADGKSESKRKFSWCRGSFLCGICKELFTDKGNCIKHIKLIHNLTPAEYSLNFGEIVNYVTENFHCKICDQKFTRQLKTIKGHLERKHCLSIEDYTRVYIDKNKENFNNTEANVPKEKIKSCQVNLKKFCLNDKTLVEYGGTNELTKIYCDYMAVNGNAISKKYLFEHMTWSDLLPDEKIDFGRSLDGVIEALFDIDPKQKATKPKHSKNKLKNTIGTLFNCATCSFTTKWSTNFFNHQKNVHGMVPTGANNCDICEFKADCFYNLIRHKKQMHGSFTQQGKVVSSKKISKSKHDRTIIKPEIEWANKCTYICKACPKPQHFDYYDKFHNHVRIRHNKCMKDYRALFGSPELTVNFHTCAICKREVKHDIGILKKHLKIHKEFETLSKYYQTYVHEGEDSNQNNLNPDKFKKEVPSIKKEVYNLTSDNFNSSNAYLSEDLEDHNNTSVEYMDIDDLLSDGDIDNDNPNSPNHTLKIKEEINTFDPVGNVLSSYSTSVEQFDDLEDQNLGSLPIKEEPLCSNASDVPHVRWANGCVYSCKECNSWTTKDYKEFASHIKTHGLHGLFMYKDKHGNPFSVEKFIKCKICNAKIKKDLMKIKDHLKEKHDTTVYIYFDKFIQGTSEEEDGIEDEMEEEEADSMDRNIYLNWVNKCIAKCRVKRCAFSSKDEFDFTKHLNEIHEMNLIVYCERFNLDPMKPWTNKVCTVCKLCFQPVSHNHTDVNNHMEENHLLSSFKYFFEYINKPNIKKEVPSIKREVIKNEIVEDARDDNMEGKSPGFSGEYWPESNHSDSGSDIEIVYDDASENN